MSVTIDRLPTRPPRTDRTLPGHPGANGAEALAPAPIARAPEPVTICPGDPGAGARPAFEDVLAWHATEIYRFALRLTGNRCDADDLYQETMLKAFRAFDRLGPDANHRAWLYRIASNTFITDRRKRDRIDPLDEQASAAIPAAEADHAACLDARALLSEVATFVDALPPKQRIALVLRKHHGLEYDEIAATLACSEAAARGNVHHALRKLQKQFGDRL